MTPASLGAAIAADATRALTGSVAHDLRTPLTALSGEIELALRRDRPASEYRAALARIGCLVAEVIQLTGDLGFTSDAPDLSAARASLATVLAPLDSLAPDVFRLTPGVPDCQVRGEANWLARAIALFVQHGIRHRAEGGVVSLRVVPAVDDARGVDLVVEAWPGFQPQAWRYLRDDDAAADPETPGLFRLTTATHILRACQAHAVLTGTGERDAVQIRCARA